MYFHGLYDFKSNCCDDTAAYSDLICKSLFDCNVSTSCEETVCGRNNIFE